MREFPSAPGVRMTEGGIIATEKHPHTAHHRGGRGWGGRSNGEAASGAQAAGRSARSAYISSSAATDHFRAWRNSSGMAASLTFSSCAAAEKRSQSPHS